MKRYIKILILATLLIAAPFVISAQVPPDPGGNPTGGGSGPPVGAPVGDGIFILSALALAYASRKVYIMRTEKQAEKA